MSDIFISYSHANRDAVEALHKHLAEAGYDAVYDRVLDPGDRFPDWIADTVRAARATLVIWSKESLESEWVRHEASMAVAAKNYVPLSAGDFPLGKMPAAFPQISVSHWSDFVAIKNALDKRNCHPRRRPEEAIHSQIMRFGKVNPLPAGPPPPARSLIGKVLGALRPARPNADSRNPIYGLFRGGRWSNHMPAKSSAFLHYEPDWLCERYARASALPGEQPYSEIFDFSEIAANRFSPRIRLEIEPGQFQIASWNGPGDEIVARGRDALIAAGKVSNEAGSVIRVSDVYVADGTADIVLRIQKAVYGDQVRSNLISDFRHKLADGREETLRSLVAQSYGQALPPLSDPRLANTLGVSTILFYRDRDVWTPALWPRASNLAVFEGGWHCSSSGAAEWWDETLAPTFENLIVGDMLREIDEELRIPKERLLALAPVALCREFARLGKPQLFFAGLVDMSHEELVVSANEAGRRAEAAGEKREALRTTIYQYPRPVLKKIHALQRARGKARHDAAYFDAADLFGKKGLTTECVTNLYYASNALPYLLSAIKGQ